MTRTEALDKIAALLSLANGNASENEAAAAMAAAQRLMAKHQIDACAVEAHEATEEDRAAETAEDGLLEGRGDRRYLPRWRAHLSAALARAHRCSVYYEGPTIRIIGAPSDAGLVRYMYAYASRQIDEMATADKARLAPTATKSWGANYRLAAASRVAERVRAGAKTAEAQAQAGASGAALMRLDERRDALARQVETIKRGLGLRSKSWSSPSYDAGARAAGTAAGDRVNLTAGGRGALGAGAAGKLGGGS